MAENLTRQLLREHLTDGELTPGSAISLKVDQARLQDATGTMALMQFEQLDVARVKVDRAVQYVDHNVIQLDFKNPDDHRMLQALCGRHGIRLLASGERHLPLRPHRTLRAPRRHPSGRRLAHALGLDAPR